MSISSVPEAKLEGDNQVSAVAPTLALLAVAAVWGSTFFLVKGLVLVMPPLDFLGVRFVITAVVVVATQYKRLRRVSKQVWKQGFALALVFSAAQLFQTVGLQTTAASVSGFITGMYVVFTPVLLAIVFRKRLASATWISVGLASTGIAVLSLREFSVGAGEALTLLGALTYAIHILMLGQWARKTDAIDLGLVQVLLVGVILGVASLPGGVTLPDTAGNWAALIYMAVFAGLGAIVLQTWAQGRLGPTKTAVILTSEPAFAAIFAVIFGGEVVGVPMVLGGALILFAMLLVETAPNPSAAATPPVATGLREAALVKTAHGGENATKGMDA